MLRRSLVPLLLCLLYWAKLHSGNAQSKFSPNLVVSPLDWVSSLMARLCETDCRAVDRSLKAQAGQDYFLWKLQVAVSTEYTQTRTQWFHEDLDFSPSRPSLYTLSVTPEGLTDAEIQIKTGDQWDCPASISLTCCSLPWSIPILIS